MSYPTNEQLEFTAKDALELSPEGATHYRAISRFSPTYYMANPLMNSLKFWVPSRQVWMDVTNRSALDFVMRNDVVSLSTLRILSQANQLK